MSIFRHPQTRKKVKMSTLVILIIPSNLHMFKTNIESRRPALKFMVVLKLRKTISQKI